MQKAWARGQAVRPLGLTRSPNLVVVAKTTKGGAKTTSGRKTVSGTKTVSGGTRTVSGKTTTSGGGTRKTTRGGAASQQVAQQQPDRRGSRFYFNITGFPFPIGPFFERRTVRNEVRAACRVLVVVPGVAYGWMDRQSPRSSSRPSIHHATPTQ